MGVGLRPRPGNNSMHASKLVEAGFVRGFACGVVFYHAGRDLSCVCHGDDFTTVGEESELR